MALSQKMFGEKIDEEAFLKRISERYNQYGSTLLLFIASSGRIPTMAEWQLLKAIETDNQFQLLKEFFSHTFAERYVEIQVIKGNFCDVTALQHVKQISGIQLVASRIYGQLRARFSFREIHYHERFQIITLLSSSSVTKHIVGNHSPKSPRVKIHRILLAGAYAIYRELKFSYPKLAHIIRKIWKPNFRNLEKVSSNANHNNLVAILVDVNFVSCTSIFERNMMDELEIFIDCNFVNFIPLVHDLLPIITPRFFPTESAGLNLQYYSLVSKAKRVYSVSEKVADDLRSFFGFLSNNNGPEVHVFNLFGIIADVIPEAPEFEDMNNVISERYFLCISTLEPRKNHLVLLAALYPLFLKYTDLKLVLIGGYGWDNNDLMSYLSETKFPDRVVVLRNISETDKYDLIGRALATIYPSQFEGFGMPILESLLSGTPTLYHESEPMSGFNNFPNSYPLDMSLIEPLTRHCERLISIHSFAHKQEQALSFEGIRDEEEYYKYIRHLLY
jgi:glycosyltransferase involved in cell wall biosynthesis